MKYEILHLKDVFPAFGENGCDATLTTYLPGNLSEINREHEKHPCLLICPGGGYEFCSQREQEPIAFYFLPDGINVFVLNYSVAPHRYPTQLKSIPEASSFRYNTCGGGELPVKLKYTPLDQRLGKKLEGLREEKGMTREELADQVGVMPRHISAIERGEKNPRLNTLERILRALGGPTEWLIYPELTEKNPQLEEITHLAATFTEEQQELVIGFMRLIRKQKYGEEK